MLLVIASVVVIAASVIGMVVSFARRDTSEEQAIVQTRLILLSYGLDNRPSIHRS